MSKGINGHHDPGFARQHGINPTPIGTPSKKRGAWLVAIVSALIITAVAVGNYLGWLT